MEYAQDRARPQHDHGAAVWAFLNRILFAAVLAVATFGIYVYFTPARQKTADMLVELANKEAIRDELELKNRLFERDRANLQNNPEYIEIVARERLNLMKSGETILRGLENASVAPTPLSTQ